MCNYMRVKVNADSVGTRASAANRKRQASSDICPLIAVCNLSPARLTSSKASVGISKDAQSSMNKSNGSSGVPPLVAYDATGAMLFIIVVLIWYSMGIVCMLAMQIKARSETIEDCARRRAKFLIDTLRDQTHRKQILGTVRVRSPAPTDGCLFVQRNWPILRSAINCGISIWARRRRIK